MESKGSGNKASRSLRRSTRQSSSKALGFEPTPRAPLKRTKRGSGKPDPVAAVNGSGDHEDGSEDEESPSKKSRLEAEGEAGCGADDGAAGTEMEVQESAGDMQNNQEQETGADKQESSRGTHPPELYQGAIGNLNLLPRVVLHEYRRPKVASGEADLMETKRVNSSTKGPTAPTKSAVPTRSLVNSHDVPTTTTSMAEYKSRMKAKIPAFPTVNHRTPSVYPSSENSFSVHQRSRPIPIKKEWVKPKKKGKDKTDGIKISSRNSSRGCMWYFWCLVALVLLGSVAFLAYKKFPVLRMVRDLEGHISRAAEPDVFADQLSLLEARFPSQRPELWKRSRIHLGKHLRTAQPTEPVSLIVTAGRSAERTLHCLAQGLASAFSSVTKTSVLQIDGASKASQDSDEVKLDIDSQLKEAFEGDKPVAIIHRLEELPPGSTLIFYRYCDHESAAYKKVFLLFTVLLPQDEVSNEHSLKDVDEMVQDYLRERLVGSSNQTAFNEMDNNKYGGLWSRISHLVLPVVSEKEVETRGCS